MKKLFQKINLIHILIIPFVVILSLAIILTSYVIFNYSEDTSVNFGKQVSEQSAFRIQKELDLYIDAAYKSNQEVIRAVRLGSIDIKDQEVSYQFLRDIVNHQKVVSTLQIGYVNGEYLGASHINNTYLKKLALKENDFTFQVIEHFNDELIDEIPNYQITERPWYKKAVASHEPEWSPIYTLYSDNSLATTLSQELINKQGYFVGVVGADVTLKNIESYLDSIKFTEHSYLFILDDENNIIGQSTHTTEEENSSDLQTINNNHNSLLTSTLKVINEHTQKDEGLFDIVEMTVDNKTDRYMISYMPYGQDKGLNWNIGVVTPEDDFFGNLHKAKLTTFEIWLISFILSIIIGSVATYLINRPIRELKDKINKAETTGSMFEHSEHVLKEVNDLSMAFSLMSKRLYESFLDLKQTNTSLEEVVTERTTELQKINAELTTMAHTDSLTKLPNIRGFKQQLIQRYQRLKAKDIDNMVVFRCDLNYSDEDYSCHHQISDERVKQFVVVMKELVGGCNVARFEKGIFAFVCVDSSIEKIESLVQKLINKIISSNDLDESIYSNIVIKVIDDADIDELLTDDEAVEHCIEALRISMLDLEASSQRNQYMIIDDVK